VRHTGDIAGRSRDAVDSLQPGGYTIHMYSTDACQLIDAPANRALERSRRACARDLAVVNPAVGCLGGCLFCPVRHRGRERTELHIRSNLPSLLERELHARRRQGQLPPGVLFNTATDSFQPVGPLLTLTHESMRIVLEAGCDLYFITRGSVPEGFGELFETHRDKIHAQVSLFSMDANLAELYEPSAAKPAERLDTIRRLLAWGVEVQGRIDPLVPFLTDTAGHLEDVLRHLRSTGVSRVATSYLVLHPQMLEQFQRALPAAQHQLIKGSFKGQSWQQVGVQQMTKLLPRRIRVQGYQRLTSIAKRQEIEVTACICTNPDLGTSCLAPATRQTVPTRGQLELFDIA